MSPTRSWLQFDRQYQPDTPVLNAGAAPLMRRCICRPGASAAIGRSTRHAFYWIRERCPRCPGSTVIAMSARGRLRSAAGTPGQATIRFIAGYAADKSERAGLGITSCRCCG
jgi:hypothetical protein